MRRGERRRTRKWLAGLGYDVEESEIRRIWHAWVRRTWRIRMASFALFFLPVSAFWIWLNFNMARSGGGIVRLFATILVYISIPIMVFVLAHRGIVYMFGRRRFFQVLRERGFDICTNCGHRLSGPLALTKSEPEAARCQECGTLVSTMIPRGESEPGSPE